MANTQATEQEVEQSTPHCSDCDDKGVVVCHRCHGTGKEECWYCHGGTHSCDFCHGKGGVDVHGEWLVCEWCKGTKSETCLFCAGSGLEPCSRCGGTGEEPCDKCSSKEVRSAFLDQAHFRMTEERFIPSAPEWWLDERDAAIDAAHKAHNRAVERICEKKRQADEKKRQAEARDRALLMSVKIIIVVVLLVIGVRNLGENVGDTVIGILWIWGAFGFFRKFILKD